MKQEELNILKRALRNEFDKENTLIDDCHLIIGICQRLGLNDLVVEMQADLMILNKEY